jgi:predicted metal-dependent phosphoesterase TrpH
VVERAAAVGLRVLALTDHDTVAGVAEAQVAGALQGVEVIAGTELTCYVGSREIHVLGYGIDITHPPLLAHCARFQEARLTRARMIGERLAEAGAPIEMDAVMAEADGGVVGRPHIARALIAAGHVKDFDEAFKRFLGEGCPANVPKMQINPEECVAVIREAGGIAIMAHPGLGNQIDLIPRLIAAGASGVEVWHSAHDYAVTEQLQVLAIEHGWLRTGGSDCHGRIKGKEPILGKWGLQRAGWKAVEKAIIRKHQEK